MMKDRNGGLADRPAVEAVAHLALELLEEADDAAKRLGDPKQVEALHDFRVALRRLHSTLRAYRPELRPVLPNKFARAVRKLAKSTNRARDVEVQLDWIEHQLPALPEPEHGIVAEITHRLSAQANPPDPQKLQARYRSLRRRLRRRLKPLAAARGGKGRFATVCAAKVTLESRRLSAALADATAWDRVESLHAARIAAKRLRYLLTPLAPDDPACKAAVKELKGIQDLLGVLHDRHVLATQLPALASSAAGDRARQLFTELDTTGRDPNAADWFPPEGATLITLAQRNRREALTLFDSLDERYLSHPARLERVLQGAAESLAG